MGVQLPPWAQTPSGSHSHPRPRTAPEANREQRRPQEVVDRHAEPDPGESKTNRECEYIRERQSDEEPVHERHEQWVARVSGSAQRATKSEDHRLRRLAEAHDG